MASTVIIRRNQRRRSSGGGSPWLQMLVTGLMFVGIAVGAVVAAGAAVGLSVYAYFAKDLPAPEQIEEMTLTSFETS
ncbi:MAG TPA: hypothetical protein PLB78_11900, partial [Anaerolineae bacterium]|nr:hypothetical protein [Anaerolineae bacterium]